MTEDLALEEEPPATSDGDASRSPSDAPVDTSARNFPDGMFQIHDPVGAYKAHTLEQIRTAYPAGAHSSCIKCRSTYVIDYLTINYVTGEYIVNRNQKRNIFHPARVSSCGDRGHDCDEHLTAERPWNIPWPARACAACWGSIRKRNTCSAYVARRTSPCSSAARA